MGKGLKAIGGQRGMPTTLSVGVGISMLIMIVVTAICAAIISSETILTGHIQYCASGILLLSALSGAVTGIRKHQGKKLHIALLIGLAYMLVLLAANALFFDGQYRGVGVAALAIFSGCILAVLIGEKGNNAPKKKRSKNYRR